MAFVVFENYDGERAYLGNQVFDVLDLGPEKKYLIDYPDACYRVVGEGEDSLSAQRLTNPFKVGELAELHLRCLEETVVLEGSLDF